MSRYFELIARRPQQKNAPNVYGSHNELDSDLSLLLSIVIKAENTIMNTIAMTDFRVSGALKMKTDAIAVKAT